MGQKEGLQRVYQGGDTSEGVVLIKERDQTIDIIVYIPRVSTKTHVETRDCSIT